MSQKVLVLHLGSNLGDRLDYLEKAMEGLELIFGKPLKVSNIYQTKAWGKTDQADFLNVAATYNTTLAPLMVLKAIKDIEKHLGRRSRKLWEQREIDLDIIFLGDEVFANKNLKIPHPQIHLRRFVLQPLYDINPDYHHPVLKKTIATLLKECPDPLDVKLWKGN